MIGHNSDNRLKSFIERIERLEEELGALKDDKAEIYKELKSDGFDPKIVRKVVAYRKMEASKRQEQEALLETYLSAIGELAGTPLGDAGKP